MVSGRAVVLTREQVMNQYYRVSVRALRRMDEFTRWGAPMQVRPAETYPIKPTEVIGEYTWRGYEKSFAISTATYMVTWNKALKRNVCHRGQYKAAWAVKWIASRKRFDLVSIRHKQGKAYFNTMPLTHLYDNMPEALLADLQLWMNEVSGWSIPELMERDLRWYKRTVLLQAQFPLLRYIPFPQLQPHIRDYFNGIAFSVRAARVLKQPNLQVALKKEIKRPFPKKLVKIVAGWIAGGPDKAAAIDWLPKFVQQVPYDMILPILENLEKPADLGYLWNSIWDADSEDQEEDPFEFFGRGRRVHFIEFFITLSHQRRMRILQAPNGMHQMSDAWRGAIDLRMRHGREIDITRYPDPEEAHNAVETLRQRIWQDENRELYERRNREMESRAVRRAELVIPEENYTKLLAVELRNDIKLFRPETAADMDAWGNEMQFCIGSYAETAATTDQMFFAIHVGEKFVGCGHIANQRIVQMLGRYNHTLPEEIRGTIYEDLLAAGILREDTTGWGMEGLHRGPDVELERLLDEEEEIARRHFARNIDNNPLAYNDDVF